jgi:hypothetical protein
MDIHISKAVTSHNLLWIQLKIAFRNSKYHSDLIYIYIYIILPHITKAVTRHSLLWMELKIAFRNSKYHSGLIYKIVPHTTEAITR